MAPDSGIVDIDEQSIAGSSAATVSEHGLARTFQNGRVFGALTVNENIALGYRKSSRSSVRSNNCSAIRCCGG